MPHNMNWKWISVFVAATGALCLSVIASLPSAPSALPLPVYPQQPAPQSAQEPLRLRDTVLRWQVLPVHTQTTQSLTALTETLGSGLCVIDVNNDGWQDLFLVGGSGHTHHYGKLSWWHSQQGHHLLLNQQGRYFLDVSQKWGVSAPMAGMGCATADLDGDGWRDLAVTGAGANRLYRNRAGTGFDDVTASSGISADHWSTGASIVDVNQDGLPDLYIANYVHLRKGARTFERNKGFDTGNIAFDATLFDPLPNRLYLNQGQLRFTDVAPALGVSDVLGRSLGSRWVDLNQDRWPDLIVINDAQTPNQVYLNQHGTGFVRAAGPLAQLETPWSHDLTIADMTGDGQPEFLLSRHNGYPPVLLATTRHAAMADLAWKTGFASTGRLHGNGWGMAVADFNNDGRPDVYLGNGLVRPDADNSYTPQAQANTLLLANANNHFNMIAPADDGYPLSARGVVSADLDNDGQLEILLTNNNDPLQILVPEQSNARHWLGLDIADLPTGTRIDITLPEGRRTHWVGPAQGFLSQGDSRVHIGLGASARIDAVHLVMPSGATLALGALAVDRYHRFNRQGDSLATASSTQPPSPPPPAQPWAQDPVALQYLFDLLIALDSPQATALLYQLWDNRAGAGPDLLLPLNVERAPRLLWLLRSALQADDPQLQLRAIAHLRTLELEYSTAWLIPLLASTDSQVACAAAGAFEFFFAEEEAVTHRKYLAVAPLIQLLHSSDPARQICAANALANAERKRAVDPLLQHMATNTTPTARAAAIRALGLIRDTKAITPLLTQLGQPGLPDEVVASTLVALKRLDAPNLGATLQHVLGNASPTTSATSRLGILTYLRSHPDGLVFQREQLAPYETAALQVLQQTASPLPAATLNAALSLIQQAAPNAILPWMQSIWPQLQDDEQRADWLLAMLRMQQAIPAGIGNFLQSANDTQLQAFADALAGNSLTLTESQLDLLLQRITASAASGDLANAFMPALSTPSRERLSALLVQRSDGHGNKPPSTALCSLLSPSVVLEVVQVKQLRDPVWLECAYHNAATQRWTNADRLQLRIALNQLATATQPADAAIHSVLVVAAAQDALVAQTLLPSLLPALDDAQFHAALAAIMQHGLQDKVRDTLWQTLRASTASPARRLHAAHALLDGQTRTDILSILNSEILQHEIL